jgi:hypothetical protein
MTSRHQLPLALGLGRLLANRVVQLLGRTSEDSGSEVQLKPYDVMRREVRTIQAPAEEERHKRRLDVRDIDLPGSLPDRPCGFVNSCLSGVCQSGDSQEWMGDSQEWMGDSQEWIQDQTQPRTGLT